MDYLSKTNEKGTSPSSDNATLIAGNLRQEAKEPRQQQGKTAKWRYLPASGKKIPLKGNAPTPAKGEQKCL